MGADERWLSVMWPTIRSHLPPSPGRVAEIGCGRLGGFVPKLRDRRYDAVGIDPVAPDGEGYLRTEVERASLPRELDAVIACTSLHHVRDPGEVLEQVAAALKPAGLVIIVEWDWESFDEATARWCFDRLDASDSDTWLKHRHDAWISSGQTWEQYLRGWADEHGLHGARGILRELDMRFQRLTCYRSPYFFVDLAETSESDELNAINAGEIKATRIDYVGRVP